MKAAKLSGLIRIGLCSMTTSSAARTAASRTEFGARASPQAGSAINHRHVCFGEAHRDGIFLRSAVLAIIRPFGGI